MERDISEIPGTVPTHIGFIMDGNGRWATAKGLPRTAGHLAGLKAARRVIAESARLGIRYVTLYAFSTENWKRSEEEVSYLMTMIATKLHGELSFYREHGIKILVRGDVSALPEKAVRTIETTIRETASNQTLTCVLAINYGGQDEIARAVNRWQEKTKGEPRSITPADIAANLDTPQVPPPDIIVRSAGEQRLSNFMLWDSAYAEFAFYDTLWPDWGSLQVQTVCADFAKRTRKFGGVIA
jgi:undecaprenyl diphosphate synthase